MTRYLIPMVVLALFATTLHADERGETLRKLHQEHADKVVVLTWTTTQSAMGQQMETHGATAGLIVDDCGLVMVSNQVFGSGIGGIAGMFGRGQSSGPENFKLHDADGNEIDTLEAHTSGDINLKWFAAGVGEEAAVSTVKFPEEAFRPEIGDEVVIIGAHDEALNYARFFKTARINAVVEDGKYYGLDGSVQDCLGAVVMTLEGKLLGVIGEKKGRDTGGGGMGRMLGGLSDPSRALGNRVLVTPEVFADELEAAKKKVLSGELGGETEPTTEPRPVESTEGGFEGTIANATYRERQQDYFILIDVKSGDAPEENAKVSILDGDGNEVAELTITRRYNEDPLDPESPIIQVGGFIKDPEKSYKFEKGMKVVVPSVSRPGQPVEPALPPSGFRGIERFMKVDEKLLGDNYGDAKIGFRIAQRPARDSACDKAGLKNGDLITKVNDKPVTEEMTLTEFLELLRDQEGEVTLTVYRRDGTKLDIKVAG